MTSQQDREPEPDPDVHAQLWADKAPRGWKRCAECGEEWAITDDHQCECNSINDEPSKPDA